MIIIKHCLSENIRKQSNQVGKCRRNLQLGLFKTSISSPPIPQQLFRDWLLLGAAPAGSEPLRPDGPDAGPDLRGAGRHPQGHAEGPGPQDIGRRDGGPWTGQVGCSSTNCRVRLLKLNCKYEVTMKLISFGDNRYGIRTADGLIDMT